MTKLEFEGVWMKLVHCSDWYRPGELEEVPFSWKFAMWEAVKEFTASRFEDAVMEYFAQPTTVPTVPLPRPNTILNFIMNDFQILTESVQ